MEKKGKQLLPNDEEKHTDKGNLKNFIEKANIKQVIIFATIFMTIMSIGVISSLTFSPLKITNMINEKNEKQEIRKQLNEIYDISFKFDKTSTKGGKIFLPKYLNVSQEEAKTFKSKFFSADQKVEEEEFDQWFQYKSGTMELKVYKFIPYVSFIDTEIFKEQLQSQEFTDGENTSVISEKAIVNAKSFLETKQLLPQYSNITTKTEGEIVKLEFINTISEFENYAFPTNVITNGDKIAKLDYYYYNYEKINYVNFKTMSDAFLELPKDIGENSRVNLKSCKIVYIFGDSIVQPAYLFEGEVTGGKSFRCFVKAAKYNN